MQNSKSIAILCNTIGTTPAQNSLPKDWYFIGSESVFMLIWLSPCDIVMFLAILRMTRKERTQVMTGVDRVEAELECQIQKHLYEKLSWPDRASCNILNKKQLVRIEKE